MQEYATYRGGYPFPKTGFLAKNVMKKALLLNLVLLAPLAAQGNFDHSYLNIGFGYSVQNYANSSEANLFDKYKSNFTLGWGHYFTGTTSYEIQYSKFKSKNTAVAIAANENLLDLTLLAALNIDTASQVTQFGLLLKQSYPFNEGVYGTTSLLGVAGINRGYMKHSVSGSTTTENITAFTLKENAVYPSIGMGLLFQPHNSSIQFSLLYLIDGMNKFSKQAAIVNDSTNTPLGTVTLSPKNTSTVKATMQYLF